MRGSMALPGGVQPLPTQETGFVESGGERIYYESTGSGETLVLTHGYGGNHAIWFQQVVAFAPRYRVVTWDARGFGRSTRSSGDVSVGAAALDLETLLDHLGVERAHLVGQSMGGWTVLRFALDHPQRVHSLVLADTPGGIATAELAEAWLRLGRDSAAAPSPAELPIDRHPAIDADLGSRDPALAFLYRQIASVAAPVPEEIPRLLAATSVADEELQRLGVPVLFVVGSTDPIFPPELIHATAARVPNARVVELPGGGHSPYFEQAAAWNRVLAEFLRDR